nr:hypothetical protein [Tanacetum cinerariifolium]
MLACFTTFSNILFDAEYEFDSVDNQSLHKKDFPKEIFSNPLFEEEINSIRIGQHHFNVESDLIGSLLNHDSSIIPSSSKIESLFDEFIGELPLLKSILPGIDETDYHPENEIRLSQRHHFNAESDLIESLLNHDSSIIPSSSKIDSLLDDFTSELTLLKSIPPGIDETGCYPKEDIRLTKIFLYDNSSPRPPKEFVSENSNAKIESFSPSHIPVEDSDSFMEEIDLSFTPDDPMPLSIEEDDYDSERDILIREELLDNYSLLFPKNESFHFNILSLSRPLAKPLDENTGILNIKMMGDNSEQKVPILGLMITLVSNHEKSPDLLSHRGLKIF